MAKASNSAKRLRKQASKLLSRARSIEKRAKSSRRGRRGATSRRGRRR